MADRRVPGLVVVTHGQLATELLNAAEMIVGDLPACQAVLDRLARRRDGGPRRRSPRRSPKSIPARAC
jgi:hypothetical protein